MFFVQVFRKMRHSTIILINFTKEEYRLIKSAFLRFLSTIFDFTALFLFRFNGSLTSKMSNISNGTSNFGQRDMSCFNHCWPSHQRWLAFNTGNFKHLVIRSARICYRWLWNQLSTSLRFLISLIRFLTNILNLSESSLIQ